LAFRGLGGFYCFLFVFILLFLKFLRFFLAIYISLLHMPSAP
jgi:hypothetical protein